jgi:hypothetical protein
MKTEIKEAVDSDLEYLKSLPEYAKSVSELNRNNTEEDKKLAEALAGHLSVNYMNAVWYCQDLGGKCATSEDIRNMQGKYDEVRQWVVKTHEKLLTDKVLKCFRLKKLNPKEKRPNLSTALEIINYKTIGKAKKKIRNFLYE